ncbi:MAG: MiaB/RimO family radical SAM methylthiotransferase, partial [Candidatus Gastranaerophilaceae bacterium]|nr:MiaB/RimO family radical SAM methylthiotransferase [Candidatus Gastranaerophilaceae bacterium]
MKRFLIHTMGCKSNQFEGTLICENLLKNGYIQVQKFEDADFYILNSCSVTHKSDNEALYLLRNSKHKNSNIINVLTGCFAQVEKENLLEYDFIDFVVGNNEKLSMANVLDSNVKICVSDIMDRKEFTYVPITDTLKTRASLKIQDGCNNRCSYCIIPFARGNSRSADSKFIIEQINNLVDKGYKEIVFTGIHIGLWGSEFGLNLLDLLKKVEEETQVVRYRLGSLYPNEISDEMLQFLSQSDKFCPHFHLSLQSACDKTLRSMNRHYTVDDFLCLIDKINSIFKLPFIGSDIIVGFAGETDEDFEITRSNLGKSGLTQIHTFPYSIRKGTAGA